MAHFEDDRWPLDGAIEDRVLPDVFSGALMMMGLKGANGVTCQITAATSHSSSPMAGAAVASPLLHHDLSAERWDLPLMISDVEMRAPFRIDECSCVARRLSSSSVASESSADMRIEECTPSDVANDFDLSDVELWPTDRREEGVQIHDQQTLLKEMHQLVDSVVEVSQLTDSECWHVLQQHRWDVCRAIEETTGDKPEVVDIGRADKCIVCWEPFGPIIFTSTGCLEHQVCPECLRGHIESQARLGGRAVIECPGEGCCRLLPFAQVEQSLDQHTYNHIIQNQVDAFVATHPQFVWCPIPGCGRALQSIGASSLAHNRKCVPMSCDPACGHSFCMGCLGDVHMPTPCDMMESWQAHAESVADILRDLDIIRGAAVPFSGPQGGVVESAGHTAGDDESARWMDAHTKACPRCHARIEKNGGCSFMTCRCGATFCWFCMKDHGHIPCNRYNPDPTREAIENRQRVQEQLSPSMRRFVHFYSRYIAHQRSIRLQVQTLRATSGAIEGHLVRATSRLEAHMILKNLSTVLQFARATLSSTYIFAFYLRPSMQQIIFEDNQEQLETALEKLSNLVENRVLHEAFVGDDQFFKEVVDLVQFCDDRATKLIDHCAEGMGGDTFVWNFNMGPLDH
mmetsp:Transcript_15491/g.40100  ORF Transcript_15491/g.40100 Transcript_15491/m.40100 type:complete len:628 (-) Transcript_15491:2195-4078(-)|eukprot:CAMPEP_0206329218 /NCGR_PEP_ID=MMETSP0106_2-20121207/23085_1 /ASSEMBLY_ACC=CAM_ASM_000206 /TAXON_ID=81532 /ORGANISM="Acanthoeca-like sp., Strain 10tr" /LENGTH=627 /DNA_ID=CAMNT_0053761929 /DNA_START=243 /DNA_END=2127 /DNA_ORIENTATION=+